MRRFLAALVVLALTHACAKPKPPAPPRSFEYTSKAQLFETATGMRVLVLPDENTNLVEVSLRVKSGAGADPKGKAGLAHVVEHMLYEIRQQPDRPTLGQRIAAVSLYQNAYTHWETTHFYATAPAEMLPALMQLEAERLSATCERLGEKDFLREREVVLNELRQRGYADTEAALVSKLLKVVYGEGHPYHRPIGGIANEVASLTREDVCAFIEKHYAPGNAIMVVSGRVTPKTVRRLAGQFLARLPERAAPPPVRIPGGGFPRKSVLVTAPVEKPSMYVFFRLPGPFSPDAYMVEAILSRLDSRLEKVTHFTHTEAIDSFVLGGERDRLLAVVLDITDVKHARQALKAVREAVKTLADGVDLNVFRERKRVEILEKAEHLAGRGSVYADYLQFDTGLEFVIGELKRLDAMSRERTTSLVAEIFDTDDVSVIVVQPGDVKLATSKRAEVDFTATPHDKDDALVGFDPAEARRPIVVPRRPQIHERVREVRLENGFTAYLLPVSQLPIVDIRLIFGTGRMHEPGGMAGIAELSAAFMTPYIGSLAQESTYLMYVFYKMGGALSYKVGEDRTVFYVRGLSGYVDGLLRGLERFVHEGEYKESSFKSYRRNLTKLLEDGDVADELRIERAYLASVYGRRHPYATAAALDLDRLGNITADAAEDFKRTHYRAGNATLIVTGNFDPDLVEQHVRYTFGEWQKAGQRMPAVETPAQPETGPHYLAAERDLTQVRIRIGFPTPGGIDADYPRRLILRRILAARLAAVRTRLAASYGVNVEYTLRHGAGTLTIAGDVDAMRAGEALEAILTAIDEVRKGESLEPELVMARRGAIQSILAEANSAGAVADELEFLLRHELPMSFYSDLVLTLARTTLDDVLPLAARELAPERMTVLVQGDLDAVTAAYTAAGIENVRVVE